MKNFKVPHDAEGDHRPLTPKDQAIYTEPYELKGVGLKFVCIEVNGDSTHIVWEDVKSGKLFRSDVYILSDILTTGIRGVRASFAGGLRIQGDFEFEQKGPYVLLTVKEEEEEYVPATSAIIDYAVEFCQRFLDKGLTPGQLKKEMKFFIKAVKDRREAEGNG